jgi:hypothetical protein
LPNLSGSPSNATTLALPSQPLKYALPLPEVRTLKVVSSTRLAFMAGSL